MRLQVSTCLGAFMLLLSGCASFGTVATVIPSSVPVSKPLVPAVVYLPYCSPDEYSSRPGVPGVMFCRDLLGDLKNNLAPHGKSRQLAVHEDLAGDAQGEDFKPDRSLEASMHAAYRVIVSPPSLYRGVFYTTYGPPVDQGLETTFKFRIIDIETGEVVGKSALSGGGMVASKVAADVANRLRNGLIGPRCAARDLGAFQKAVKCNTFALPALDYDD